MTASPPPIVRGRPLRIGPCSARIDTRIAGLALVLLIILLAIGAISLVLGSVTLGPLEVMQALFGIGEERSVRTVQGRRLPRLLCALLVGAALGVAGCVFQSLSRNALGSPDIIGFTSGAATGAVAQITIFGGGVLETALAAVVGGLVTAFAVYLLARKDRVTGGIRLVLVGIGIGAIMAAVTDLLLVRAGVAQASAAQVWQSGSLTGRGWPHVWSLVAALAVLLPLVLALVRALRMIEMGDDVAAGLGIAVERIRFSVLVVGVLLTAVATAVAGPIAFVALAAPQIVVRVARRGSVLVVLSALMGAILLALADIVSQHIEIGLRLPIGIVTSIIGGLYLIWLLARRV
ncbi:iron chelate uptake ABC transporter family permease subunit [Leucobacter sp. CSA1]|uniref:Iron chelate uptake ABC transporter family permease subunit n=1 Tax=Leucobacter chromiisoli TaxID=2796471 RepID=A0A934UUB4_9MICO|nr:iron chelate uptake ABC transporter family permease subunit [Leucobacter chromiisoli]MBK0417767.1 iron chelate uptake ABC transporter family permease subunit [Leucobacter chromiisoli]